MNEPIRIVGSPGSPYSRKLRATLRYRRIAHVWIHMGSPEAAGLPQPRVSLLPQLILPNPAGELETYVDSTPLLRQLESAYHGREVVPRDPVVTFLDALIEDFADEWVTKAMFHYRWAFRADIDQAAAILPRWGSPAMPEERALGFGKMFAERQVGRLAVVGSNPTTAPTIEASYRRLLALLDTHLTEHRFVLGQRPGAADFGLYGQLTQLVGFDPTPRAIAIADAPRVVAWVDWVDDLSGVDVTEDGWMTRDAIPPSFSGLLNEIGRVYVPFLLANAAALADGVDEVRCEIDGAAWVQKPFPYQGKCLAWLRGAYAALVPDDRAAVDVILAGTGCEALFV